MAKDPAFLFYPGDYLRDTQCLSENVQVAYDRIMCEHMRNICISQQQLNFFTKKLSPLEIDELKMVLTEIDGCYQIEWVAESIVKRKDYSISRANNRQGKTKTHDKHMNNISKSYDKHMENENENENEVVIENDIEKSDSEIFEVMPYPTFEDFWIEYDKKVGDKEKLKKKFNLIPQPEKEKIMRHIPEYKIAQPDKQFRKDPATYLNNKSWNDEIIKNNSQNGTVRKETIGGVDADAMREFIRPRGN